jgi:biotin transport system substrate-specific component
MTGTNLWQRSYGNLRGGVETFHEVHRESNLAMQVFMILTWAGVMGLLAQIHIPRLPVPFTMQTFGVVLGAVLLGTRNGTLAQLTYVGAGAFGMPWFAQGLGGWSVFTGATLGYLIAFPLAALFIGWAVNTLRIRSYYGLVGVMTLGSAIILLLGWVWLAFGFGPLVGLGATDALFAGVLPFLAGDIAKVFLAAGLAIPFLPPRKQAA